MPLTAPPPGHVGAMDLDARPYGVGVPIDAKDFFYKLHAIADKLPPHHGAA